MATEAQILEVLLGKKVLVLNQWRVFDAGGTELTNPGAVLWRGTNGAIVWGQPTLNWRPIVQRRR